MRIKYVVLVVGKDAGITYLPVFSWGWSEGGVSIPAVRWRLRTIYYHFGNCISFYNCWDTIVLNLHNLWMIVLRIWILCFFSLCKIRMSFRKSWIFFFRLKEDSNWLIWLVYKIILHSFYDVGLPQIWWFIKVMYIAKKLI